MEIIKYYTLYSVNIGTTNKESLCMTAISSVQYNIVTINHGK